MKNKFPLVSVVIATKNRGESINKAIDSILGQTYKNVEIVIIEGGLVKDAQKITGFYSNKSEKIHYFSKKDKNASEGLNNGINFSKGKYIAILDDDDYWCDKKKLEKQVNFLETHKDYILVSGGSVAIDESGHECYRVLPPETDKQIKNLMLFDCVFPHGSTVFKKSAWEKAGGYNEKVNFSWDWDLWLRMGKFGKFYNFQEYFLLYLIRDKSRGRHVRYQNTKMSLKLVWKYRNNYPGFSKAFLLGFGCYLASIFPHQKWASKMMIIPKVKNLFFKKNIYKK